MALYSNAGIDTNADITDTEADAESGLTKGTVTMEFNAVTSDAVQDLGVKVVGCNTSYQGDIYIDNIRFTTMVDTSDTSVDSTVAANSGNAVASDGSSLTVTKQGRFHRERGLCVGRNAGGSGGNAGDSRSVPVPAGGGKDRQRDLRTPERYMAQGGQLIPVRL